jgi:hypothetical protein
MFHNCIRNHLKVTRKLGALRARDKPAAGQSATKRETPQCYPNKELTQDHRSETQIKSRTECVIILVCIECIYTLRTNGCSNVSHSQAYNGIIKRHKEVHVYSWGN